MKLIIDISEEDYKNGTLINYFKCYSTELDKIIYDGTPLEAHPTSDDEMIKALKAVRTIHNGNYAPQIDEAIRRLTMKKSAYVQVNLSDERIQKAVAEAVEKMKAEIEAQTSDAVNREAVINLINPVQTVVRK